MWTERLYNSRARNLKTRTEADKSYLSYSDYLCIRGPRIAGGTFTCKETYWGGLIRNIKGFKIFGIKYLWRLIKMCLFKPIYSIP